MGRGASAGEEATVTELRVGVVGVGARSPLAVLAESSPVPARLVAAADPANDRHQRARRFLPAGVEVVSDYRELAEAGRSGLDAVVVTTPDDTHEEVACAFLRAGVPVYLEKPLAVSLKGADRVLEVARRSGTRLYVGHNMRHMAVVRLLKDVVDRGEIGEPKAVWCRHFVGNGGDYYFRDWHAERARTTGLLLQKAAHDIDVIHWIAGSTTRRVVGMGDLMVYGAGERRPHGASPGTVMGDWFSHDHWPPDALTGLNPVIDVEDLSMVLMTLRNGVMASYQQCHFTPDYWRSYTVIGTRGRAENFGDGAGGVVRVWTRRSGYSEHGSAEYPITEEGTGHDSADQRTMDEFLRFVRDGGSTQTSPVGARDAVATGALATESLRSGSVPRDVPRVEERVAAYFEGGQRRG
ncbi:gfo/Idh/MocA family oxidoreductase [Actinomyces sp. 2119]|uniref:Gfo/Idh/MocA family protein n=1 Tax=Actinomyces sp. 2119 TaxID=2321393 RepID=UPI000E6BD3C2|nr:Gfo/Idh/MocA family oxidoreductase [Actinomyces sp. 2119]RJF43865.1 gfo/Idh/MocA family oxidoreductase [Actinomyces sp. 2119]